MRTLLVIIQDRLSDLIRKGEVAPRYYNPGDAFERVELVMTNDDAVDPRDVQPMVGNAELRIHRVPAGRRLFLESLGWRPRLLSGWLEEGVRLAERLQPDLMHCHVNSLNGLLGAAVKRRLGVPLVVSLHINPDEDVRGRQSWRAHPLKRLALECHKAVERETLSAADAVVCVYPFLTAYARRYGARRTEVIYNAVNVHGAPPKASYELARPPHLVNVGRQFADKDPSVLLKAAARMPGVRVTLIGDGPLHERLTRLATSLGLESRVTFLRSISNEELCRRFPSFDLFASVNAFGGISKAVLEAMAAGLPIVANNRMAQTEPMSRDCVLSVEPSADAFRAGINRLLQDATLRQTLGMRARRAWDTLQPAELESQLVRLYQELMNHHTMVPCSSLR